MNIMKKILFFILTFYSIANSYCQTGEEFYKSGITKAESKDYLGAIIDFTKAIETKSTEQNIDNIAECYYKRGLAKNQLQDYRGASLDIQKALVSNVDQTLSDALLCLNIAIIMSKYEDFTNAIDFLNKAIEYNPNYKEAYFFRGRVKLLLDQKDSGCLDFSKAGELGYKDAYEAIKELCK